MSKRHWPGPLIGIVGGVALLASGTALASIPDEHGEIHGCYQTSGPHQGQLRVIDANQTQACKSGETSLAWSQTGPAGAQGTPGPAGPAGIAGYETVTGADVVAPPATVGGGVLAVAICPAPKRAIGGGFLDETGNVHVEDSVPGPIVGHPPAEWAVFARSSDGIPATFNAVAVCALVSEEGS